MTHKLYVILEESGNVGSRGRMLSVIRVGDATKHREVGASGHPRRKTMISQSCGPLGNSKGKRKEGSEGGHP